MGVAYKDTKLTSGPIYPAVALLHCAGCKIKSGLSVPTYFKDWYLWDWLFTVNHSFFYDIILNNFLVSVRSASFDGSGFNII